MFVALPLFIIPKFIPLIAECSLYLSLLGFLVNFIVLLSMKKHTNLPSYIVEGGLGTSGWSQGTAWVLGVMNAM
jgi:choline transport protein